MSAIFYGSLFEIFNAISTAPWYFTKCLPKVQSTLISSHLNKQGAKIISQTKWCCVLNDKLFKRATCIYLQYTRDTVKVYLMSPQHPFILSMQGYSHVFFHFLCSQHIGTWNLSRGCGNTFCVLYSVIQCRQNSHWHGRKNPVKYATRHNALSRPHHGPNVTCSHSHLTRGTCNWSANVIFGS